MQGVLNIERTGRVPANRRLSSFESMTRAGLETGAAPLLSLPLSATARRGLRHTRNVSDAITQVWRSSRGRTNSNVRERQGGLESPCFAPTRR